MHGESIAAQYRVLVMEYGIRPGKRRKPRTRDRQIICGKIINRECNDAYTTGLFEKLESWDGLIDRKQAIESILLSTAKEGIRANIGKRSIIMKRNTGGGMLKHSGQ